MSKDSKPGFTHTPGPWIARSVDFAAIVLAGDYTDEGEPDLIADISSEYALSDARLMAAAPDLYEACKAALEAMAWDGAGLVVPLSRVAQLVRAALLKVEGKPHGGE